MNKKAVHIAQKCILILSFAVCILALENVSYKELQDLNATCPNDNCQEATIPIYRKPCECDEKCSDFGDCCISSSYVQKSSVVNRRVQCLSFENHEVFGIQNCSPNWVGNDIIRSMCENVTEIAAKRNPILKLPVTDAKSMITYKNRFCAICNEVHDVIFWQIHFLEINDSNSNNRDYGNLTRDYVLSKMVFNEETQKWGVWVSSNPDGWSFLSFEANIQLQANISEFVRACQISMLQECSVNWNDEVVRRKCNAYQESLYFKNEQNGNFSLYKNVHCALCNYANIANHTCTLSGGGYGVGYGGFKLNFLSFNFALILDFNTSGGNIVGRKQLCKNEEVFDPSSKTCRTVVCGLPGFKLENGQCVSP